MHHNDIELRYQEELKKFGQNIRQIRIAKGFAKQEDFGRACKINRTRISRIETASGNIEFETIVRLAIGSRLQLRSLFDYSEIHIPAPIENDISIVRRVEIEKQKLGIRLLQLRELREMIQLDVETTTGIERSKISEYENGLINIEFRTLVKFLPALQVEMVDLFKYNDS